MLEEKKKAVVKREKAQIKQLEADMERKRMECKQMKEAQCEYMTQNAIKTQQDAAINAIVQQQVQRIVAQQKVAQEQEKLQMQAMAAQ